VKTGAAIAGGSGGLAAPVGYALAVWGGTEVLNGARDVVAALQDQGPPEALQVEAYSEFHEIITGNELSPGGRQVVTNAYYSLDILTACMSLRVTWLTTSYSQVSRTSIRSRELVSEVMPSVAVTTQSSVNIVGTSVLTGNILLDFNTIYQSSFGAFEQDDGVEHFWIEETSEELIFHFYD
jgi:hypothetical protein